MKHKKSALLALLFVFAVISSAGFLILEAHHECSGEDCPVCLEINICSHNLKLLSFAGFIFVFAGVLLFSQQKNTYQDVISFGRSDLIALKVKLSD